MTIKERMTSGIQTLGQADVALFEAAKKMSDTPDEQNQEMAFAGARRLSALASADPTRIFNELFGEEVAQPGLEALQSLSEGQVAVIGATALAVTKDMDFSGLEASPDLFDSNVYTLYDKSPEQIAFDAKALKERMQVRDDLAFKMKCLNGEAQVIDLKGKSLEEIEVMSKEMGLAAFRRREKEESFSDNPFIGSLDAIAEVVTPAVDIFTSTAEKATNFVKENPGLSIAGGLGTAGLMKMLMNGGFNNLDLGDLLLVGSLLLVGGSWLHSTKPDKFNELAGQFGIDGFFNEAPKKPMLTCFGDSKSEVTVTHLDPSPDKFGVSAESAGAVTTNDGKHRKEMIESMQQLTASRIPSVEKRLQSRSLS